MELLCQVGGWGHYAGFKCLLAGPWAGLIPVLWEWGEGPRCGACHLPSHGAQGCDTAAPPPLRPPPQWARRGKLIMPAADGSGEAGRRRSLDDPSFYSNQTCGPASFLSAMAARESRGELPEAPPRAGPTRDQPGGGGGAPAAQPPAGGGEAAAAGLGSGGAGNPHLKRIRTDGAAAEAGGGGGVGGLPLSPHGVLLPGLSPRFDHSSYDSTPRLGGSTAGGIKPIDHIFQFHKALR